MPKLYLYTDGLSCMFYECEPLSHKSHPDSHSGAETKETDSGTITSCPLLTPEGKVLQ